MMKRYQSALRILLCLGAGVTVPFLLVGCAATRPGELPSVPVGLGASYEFEAMWPVLPQDWYFAHPMGVTADASGNIYVANSMFGCIQKLSPTGKCLARWGASGSGDGQFKWPQKIALDAAGNLYITDRDNHRVQVLSPAGKLLRAWGAEGPEPGHFSEPSGIAIDRGGSVYVADTENNRIQKFGVRSGARDGSDVRRPVPGAADPGDGARTSCRARPVAAAAPSAAA